MKTIDIFSLPRVAFAHGYTRSECRNIVPAWRDGYLHFYYVQEGELHFENQENIITARKNDVVCNFRYYDTIVWADSFHSHHEVCAKVDWNYSESPLTGLFLAPKLPHEIGTTEIRDMIDSFIYGQDSSDRSNVRSVYQFLTLLIKYDELSRKTIDVPIDVPKYYLYAERAKQYIHRHIHEPITQRQVAERLEIAPGYLCDLFKAAFGCTVMQYINKVKLTSISQLVRHDRMRLYEAAALFGYNDPNYVSRLYKKIFNHNITESIPE